MKNAMKKIMSLVLVAMILVSALPFAASADSYALSVDVDGVQKLLTEGTSASYEDCLAAGGVDTAAVTVTNALYQYTVDGVITDVPFGPGDVITLCADTRVYIFTEPKAADPAPAPAPAPAPTPDPAVYAMSIDVDGVQKVLTSGTSASYEDCLAAAGVDTSKVNVTKALYQHTIDGVISNFDFAPGDVIVMKADTRVYFWTEAKAATPSTPSSKPGTGNSYDANDGTTSTKPDSYSKFHYEVYLNIYTDTTVGTVKKTIKITDGIAADGKVTLNEVKNLVFNYYKANTSAGIQFDGLYPAKGNWVMDYVADKKYDTIEGLYEAASNDYVYINVMLTNATAISSGNADSSNPKTGDELYKAITVMAVSASALAVAFYFNKKRTVA